MLLPKIRTAEMDKEYKKLEMIGKRFRNLCKETTMIIEINCGRSLSDQELAIELEDRLDVTFARFEEVTKDDFEKWCEQYDAECDPPMDKYHYLRAQA